MKLAFIISVFLFLISIAVRGQATDTLKRDKSKKESIHYLLPDNRFTLDCDTLNPLHFSIHQNFFLNPHALGEALPKDVCNLLDNVISNFYANLDTSIFPKITLLVASSKCRNPRNDTPQYIRKKNFAWIFLNTQDLFWSQYSYQFAHELCHYVIDTDFPPAIDRFGWFEESICELASLSVMDRMATTWATAPPYASWSNYSEQLRLYVDTILQAKENTIPVSFDSWLSNNLEALYKDRYNRQLNRTVAIRLFSLFKIYPQLWKTIQYLKKVRITNEMDFKIFLKAWKEILPINLLIVFKNIEDALG